MQTQERGGSIVNVASVSGRRPTPGTVAYGAAKAGVESITSTLAVEWAPKVRVNSVVVGMVETEQSELFYGDADSIAAISMDQRIDRMGEGTHQQSAAVGCGLGDNLVADHAGGPRTIVDDDGGAQCLLQLGLDEARRRVRFPRPADRARRCGSAWGTTGHNSLEGCCPRGSRRWFPASRRVGSISSSSLSFAHSGGRLRCQSVACW